MLTAPLVLHVSVVIYSTRTGNRSATADVKPPELFGCELLGKLAVEGAAPFLGELPHVSSSGS
jgi:hypothetical protein